MTRFSPQSKFARVLDLCLDLLLVLILLGAPLIFYTKAHDVFEFNKITAVRDFSALAASLFLIKMLFVRPFSITRSPLDFPLLAWLAVALVCTFNTVNIRLSLHGVYEDFEGITTLVNYAFLLYLAQNHIRTERQIRLGIGSLIIAGTVAGFYGMLQNFGIDFVPWNPATYSADRMFSTMGNPNFLAAYLVMSLPVCLVVFLDMPDRIRTDPLFCTLLIVLGALGTAGLCALFDLFQPQAASAFKPLIEGARSLSPLFYDVKSWGQAFLTQKFWVTWILIGFPLIAAGLLYVGRLRLVLLVSMVFQVVAILFTKSRGAGIALAILAIIFAAYFIWDSRRDSEVLKRNRYWLIGFAASIALAIMFVPQVRDTTTHMFGRIFDLLSFSNVRFTPRLYIWRSALQMLQDHPFFGTGLDTFQISFPEYRLALYWALEWNGTPEKAHNMVMQIAATMGFAGLTAFFWLNAAFVWRLIKDLGEQASSSRRLLMVGCFAGIAAFFTQNLFSFTVVGYGVTYWILMGFIPAMQRTWATEEPVEGAEGRDATNAWKWALGLVGATGLACLMVGTSFEMGGDTLGLRMVLALAGLAALVLLLLKKDPSESSDASALLLAGTASLGFFLFCIHSTRIWVADSFYKQGQVGIQINNPGYSVMMYQKAAGRIDMISPEKEITLYEPLTRTPQAGPVTFTAGLNPDQELYWVKMGIAFENAAASTAAQEDKMRYFRTALAIHQLTLEMNPINGYNFNNKGRVLKAMGESFGRPEFFHKALAHYKEAIRLDEHNVYFNLDYANTFLNLGDLANALVVCQSLIKEFPDFAVPYSYSGFIKLRQGDSKAAVEFFDIAVKKDWKRDIGSKSLAAVNLGILHSGAGRFEPAKAAFEAAMESNPDLAEAYTNYAQMLAQKGRRDEARQILMRYRIRNAEHPSVNAMLKGLGG